MKIYIKSYLLICLLAIGMAATAIAADAGCGTRTQNNWVFDISEPGSCTVDVDSFYADSVVWDQDVDTGVFSAEVRNSFSSNGANWTCNTSKAAVKELTTSCTSSSGMQAAVEGINLTTAPSAWLIDEHYEVTGCGTAILFQDVGTQRATITTELTSLPSIVCDRMQAVSGDMTYDPNVIDFFSREDCADNCEGSWTTTVTYKPLNSLETWTVNLATATWKNTPGAAAYDQSFSFDLTIPGTAIVVQGTTTLAAQG